MKTSLSLGEAGDVLTVREVQRILGIGRNATYELLASGRLPSIRRKLGEKKYRIIYDLAPIGSNRRQRTETLVGVTKLVHVSASAVPESMRDDLIVRQKNTPQSLAIIA